MKTLLFLCILVINFNKDLVCELTVDDLIGDLTKGLRSAKFSWNGMVDNIQKPVRIRRLGSIGKRKLKKTLPTPIYKTLPTTEDSLRVLPFASKKIISLHDDPPKKPAKFKKLIYPEQSSPKPEMESRNEKLKLPYLFQPVWSSKLEWERMQRPQFARTVGRYQKDEGFEAVSAVQDKFVDKSNENYLGNLFFI